MTDFEGRFAFDGLSEAIIDVTVPDGQAWSATPTSVLASTEPTDVRIVGRPTSRLEVEVLDPSGTPASGVIVNLTPLDQDVGWSAMSTSVGEDGRAALPLPAGRYRVSVRFPRAWTAHAVAGGLSQFDEVVVLSPGEVRSLQVHESSAAELGTVAVVVRDEGGNVLADREVRLARSVPARLEGGLVLTTDADGRGVFSELPRGRYTLQVVVPSTAARTEVDLDQPRVEVVLEAVRLGALAGVVRDATGRPVVGAHVGASPLKAGRVEEARTDADGRFTIAGLTEHVSVTVTAEGFEQLRRTHRNDGRPLVLTLALGRVLAVRGQIAEPFVPDDTGVMVTWLSAGGSWAQRREVVAGAFEQRFAGVPVGASGRVVIRVGTLAPSIHDIAPGQESLDLPALRLERGLTVRGTVQDPTGFIRCHDLSFINATIEGPEPLGIDFEGELDRSGRFELRGLPARPMVLHVFARSRASDDPRRASATVRFDPRTRTDLGTVAMAIDERHAEWESMNAMKVRVLDPTGTLGRIGFRDGDLVVGTNGQEFTGLDHMTELLMKADLEPTAFEVLRGAERVAIPVEASAFHDQDLGGSLEPTRR